MAKRHELTPEATVEHITTMGLTALREGVLTHAAERCTAWAGTHGVALMATGMDAMMWVARMDPQLIERLTALPSGQPDYDERVRVNATQQLREYFTQVLDLLEQKQETKA